MAFTAAALAAHAGGTVYGDAACLLEAPGALASPRPGTFVYAPNARVFREALAAGFDLILAAEVHDPAARAVLVVPDPKKTFLQLLRLFAPADEALPGIDPRALVAASAVVDPSASVAALVAIGERVRIGPGCRILTGAVLDEDVVLGTGVRIGERAVVLSGTVLGDGVTIGAGSVLGSAGFGYERNDRGGWEPVPQLGLVRIEDNVTVGCNCTIDRATTGETVIGSGTRIDNLVHIAHNVRLGPDNLVLAQTGIAGSVESGRGCIFGGQVGVADHCRIGDGVVIGSKAGVQRHALHPHTHYWGNPARRMEEARRINAALTRLPELVRERRTTDKS